MVRVELWLWTHKRKGRQIKPNEANADRGAERELSVGCVPGKEGTRKGRAGRGGPSVKWSSLS